MDTSLTLAVLPQPTTQEALASRRVVGDLFEQLNQRGIRYCHWKSNLRLERGLKGLTDLDLLVDRADEPAFNEILSENGIKPFLAPPGKRYPAIEDFLGFDLSTERLFHLHVHYELVLGEQFVKNYRLPLELQFLDHTRLSMGVKIPAPELELIVLCLRALLKYRDRDVIKDMLSIRSPGLKDEMVEEINWLLNQTCLEKVAQTLTTMTAGIVPSEIVLEFLDVVASTPRAGYQLYRLRSRVRQALRKYQRRSSLQASTGYFREAWRRRRSFWKLTPDRKMTLVDRGMTFALVGADGAGKSTLCQEIAAWLGWRIDIQNYYLGSKQPSWLSGTLYWWFRIARRSHRTLCRLIGEKNIASRFAESVRQTLLYSHYLSTGYDRLRRYNTGRGKAEAGSIVVFDRFPLQAPLDGPVIHLAANDTMGRIDKAFANLERSIYRKFEYPDCLILLDVSPDVSILRKPDHKRSAIEEKSRVLSELIAGFDARPNDMSLIHLNANLPLEDVSRQIKQSVWEKL